MLVQRRMVVATHHFTSLGGIITMFVASGLQRLNHENLNL